MIIDVSRYLSQITLLLSSLLLQCRCNQTIDSLGILSFRDESCCLDRWKTRKRKKNVEKNTWQISRVRRAKRKGGDEKSVGYIAGRFRTRHRGWRLATGRCPKTRHCYCSSLHPFLSIAPNSDFGVTHTCMQARMHARMHERVWGTIERVNKRRLRLRRGTRIARLTMRTKYSRVRICSLTIVGENVCVCSRVRAHSREFLAENSDGNRPVK